MSERALLFSRFFNVGDGTCAGGDLHLYLDGAVVYRRGDTDLHLDCRQLFKAYFSVVEEARTADASVFV